MTVVVTWNVLISIVDGYVQANDLNSLDPMSKANKALSQKTKSASTIAVMEALDVLIVCARKHMIVYSRVVASDGTLMFVEKKDIGIPDNPRSLIAASFKTQNDISVVLGMKHEYVHVNLRTGHSMTLHEIGRNRQPIMCSTCKEQSSSEGSYSYQPEGLLHDQFLVAVENEGKAFDVHGQRLEDSTCGILWSETPKALVYSHPFIVAALPKRIEIHLVQSGSLVQVIPNCSSLHLFASVFSESSPKSSKFLKGAPKCRVIAVSNNDVKELLQQPVENQVIMTELLLLAFLYWLDFSYGQVLTKPEFFLLRCSYRPDFFLLGFSCRLDFFLLGFSCRLDFFVLGFSC
jgi:hypothetical protein